MFFSQLLSKILTDAVQQKAKEELLKGKEKKIVQMPLVLRITAYIITPIDIGISSLGFILPPDTFPTLFGRIAIIIFCISLFLICILYLLLSGTRIVYNNTEIEVTTFWQRKRQYNVLDIKNVRDSLHFSIITFSDSFVILTDSMTASSEFYDFAVKHAQSVNEKY